MIEIRIEGVDKLLAKLNDDVKAIARAMRNAENTTATALRKAALQSVVRIFNIKEARLKKDSRGRDTIFIRRSSPTNPGATITFRGGDSPKSGDRPGLQHFKTDKQERNKKQKGWTPTVQIRRGGSPESIANAFYGVGKLKGQGIFQRQEGLRKIVRRTGPSIKQMVEHSEVLPSVKAQGESIFRQKLIEAIGKQLAKK